MAQDTTPRRALGLMLNNGQVDSSGSASVLGSGEEGSRCLQLDHDRLLSHPF
jgi:hypothetical protein